MGAELSVSDAPGRRWTTPQPIHRLRPRRHRSGGAAEHSTVAPRHVTVTRVRPAPSMSLMAAQLGANALLGGVRLAQKAPARVVASLQMVSMVRVAQHTLECRVAARVAALAERVGTCAVTTSDWRGRRVFWGQSTCESPPSGTPSRRALPPWRPALWRLALDSAVPVHSAMQHIA